MFNVNEKCNKTAALFSGDNMPDDFSYTKPLTSELEKCMSLQLRTWWNATTLEEYANKAMIPRGLRIKKNPTFQTTEDFTRRCNETLSECSLKLIKLLIEHEQAKLQTVSEKIAYLQETIKERLKPMI